MKLYSTVYNRVNEERNKQANTVIKWKMDQETTEKRSCIVSVKKFCEKKGREQRKWNIYIFFFFCASLSPRIPCLDIRIKSFHSRGSRHRSLQFLFYHIHASTYVDRSFIMTRYILGKASGWIGIRLWRE